MKKFLFAFVILSIALLTLPLITHAIELPSLAGPLVSCSAVPDSPNGLKQCTSLCDIFATIQNIVKFVFALLLYVLAPLFIAIGGISIAMSGANEGLRSTGRKMITQTVIGAVIALLSFLVINTFIKAIGVSQDILPNLNSSFVCSPQNAK